MIVSVSGTNATNSASIDIDLDFKLTAADNEWFPQSEQKGILLHQGFYGAFQRIIPAIEEEVAQGIQGGVKSVIVTGHSLGGRIRVMSLL